MNEAAANTVTVVVPTYRRVANLRRCLAALAAQRRTADEVIVTVRDTDEETRAYLAGDEEPVPAIPLRTVTVQETGVVAAMNAGLAASTGSIIALTDDDAAPHPDWLERIGGHFAADPKIGGVGGRDFVYIEGRLDGAGSETETVGLLTWYGLAVGNHHIGKGGPRDVHYLKGVNCAYRASALKPIGFDPRLRGQGAQVHWELMLGLGLLRRGWRLVYDPAAAVDHYPAIRYGQDQRCVFQPDTHFDILYNETLAITEYLTPARRMAFRAWGALVGTRFAPGMVQLARLLLLGKGDARAEVPARCRATQAGRQAGYASAWQRAGTSALPAVSASSAARGAAEEVGV